MVSPTERECNFIEETQSGRDEQNHKMTFWDRFYLSMFGNGETFHDYEVLRDTLAERSVDQCGFNVDAWSGECMGDGVSVLQTTECYTRVMWFFESASGECTGVRLDDDVLGNGCDNGEYWPGVMECDTLCCVEEL